MGAKARLHLVTGFLGSGKTTLLSNLLRDLAGDHKVAVIQNEFAPTGIDGKTLKREAVDFKLVEINNGSVFCVCQLGSFAGTLRKLLDSYQPDLIFLEASGLADPISIINLLDAPEVKDDVALGEIVCLLDAVNFHRGLSGLQRFRHQVMVADTVLINKADLFEGDLDEIRSSARELNPHAKFITTSHAVADWRLILESGPYQNKSAASQKGKTSAGRPDMGAAVLRTHDQMSSTGLHRLLKTLQQDCPRIKGHLNMRDGSVVSIQSVYGQLELETVRHYSGPSELIAFGHNLTAGTLRTLFRECAA